jgi:hypothetical protein
MFNTKGGLTLDTKKNKAKNSENVSNIGFLTSLYFFILMVINNYTDFKVGDDIES